jgi:hypothetical protein
MNMHIKTEVQGIFRDSTNKALLNKDDNSLVAYKRMKKKNADIDNVKEDVEILKKDVSDIKALLIKIAEKL